MAKQEISFYDKAQVDALIPDVSEFVERDELSTVAFSGDYDDLTDKPTLAAVATTGNYDDLINKPTIPAAQVNADWNAASGVAQILNKPDIITIQGVFNNWDDVPSNVSGYVSEPKNGDYIIVKDLSDYSSSNIIVQTIDNTGARAALSVSDGSTTINVPYGSVSGEANARTFFNKVIIYYTDLWYIKTNDYCVVNNIQYQPFDTIASWAYTTTSSVTASYSTYNGINAMQYNGIWTNDGRNGWIHAFVIQPLLSTAAFTGNYQDLKNKPTIPAGVTLYNTTGQNTNGAMTQKAVTDALPTQSQLVPDTTGASLRSVLTYITTGPAWVQAVEVTQQSGYYTMTY